LGAPSLITIHGWLAFLTSAHCSPDPPSQGPPLAASLNIQGLCSPKVPQHLMTGPKQNHKEQQPDNGAQRDWGSPKPSHLHRTASHPGSPCKPPLSHFCPSYADPKQLCCGAGSQGEYLEGFFPTMTGTLSLLHHSPLELAHPVIVNTAQLLCPIVVTYCVPGRSRCCVHIKGR
jgi:hypothetical protein